MTSHTTTHPAFVSDQERTDYLAASGMKLASRRHLKDLGDGTYLAINPLIFHWTMIRGQWADTLSYDDRWCYATMELAEQALAQAPLMPPDQWEPDGWHRHPKTDRYRPVPEAVERGFVEDPQPD